MELSHAETLGGAIRLLHTCGRQLRSSRDLREIANTLGAVGRDDEMSLASFSGEAREQRTDDTFIIGMSEDGDDWPGLSVRRVRGDYSQRRDGKGGDEITHTILCSLDGLRGRPVGVIVSAG